MYRLIKVSGGDTAAFLQGQLTQDIGLLDESKSLPAAWCNPQGRVIATMQLIVRDDTICLVVAEDIAESVCEKLARFRFRSKVDFEISDAAEVQKLVGGADLSDDERKCALIEAGIPTISAENSEKFTPHMLNLDRLGAISFTKGCYTGQEVVARTENLGSSKRRLMRYRCESPTVAVGDKLADESRNVGEVVNVSGSDLLAVTPVAIHEQALTLDGVIATPVGLPY